MRMQKWLTQYMQVNIICKWFNFLQYQAKLFGRHKPGGSLCFKTKAASKVAAVCYLDVYFFESHSYLLLLTAYRLPLTAYLSRSKREASSLSNINSIIVKPQSDEPP